MGVKELERARKCFKSALKRETYARRDANESQRVAEFSRKAATKAGKLQEVAAKQLVAARKELDQEMRIATQENEASSEANNELERTLQKIQEMSDEESRKCRRRLTNDDGLWY